MKSLSFRNIIQAIEIHNGENVNYNANGCYCKCPYHGSDSKKLYIADGENRVLMDCKTAGCDPKDILEAVGLSIKDIYHKPFDRKEIDKYIAIKKDKEFKEIMHFEILILMQWLTACERGNRDDVDKDKDRIIKALKVVQNSSYHFINNKGEI
ncbi:hypothetical protein BJAS_P3395 [Bathymodiolus japonicus methanotrophic gill symbiont]|uniref:hypothetical protein n=1 Tax=Bathymodiolus japonicus methanotrophic gill symbiont TaxID=113269 RepID=UPI001B5B29F5|nr:hypothetical protein [Bathymodiolus japonicus methanotrophic gill symbiont]GFO72861.1 hypothetical protein BJAS_P3395 [Bathymodiolus japonicus methanotrophic gill symbiont]